MDVAVLLLIVACVAVGVVAAIVTTWRLRARLYEVEDRLEVLGGIQQREVKSRAATERWKKADKDEALLSGLSPAQPVKRYNWWEALPRTVGKG